MCHMILPVGVVVVVLSSGLVNSEEIANKDPRWYEQLQRENHDHLGSNGTKDITSDWDELLVKGSDETCHDNWKLKRCKRKKSQGKCGKKNVAKNCQKTCDLCTDLCPSHEYTPYDGCGVSPKGSRIIGGEDVSPHSIPWQVGLLFATDNYQEVGCGGTLLTDKHVLSAAHCMFYFVYFGSIDASDIRVVVAEHDQSDSFDGIRHEIRSYTNHPQYFQDAAYDYDFSMLHLTLPVELGDLAVPACLPDLRFSDDKLVGKYLTVSGWRRTDNPDYDDYYPDLLQTVDVPVLSQQDCIEAYGSSDITNSMICAGHTDGGMDACKGDSGGPLTYEENGKSYLIGVVSWGIGCALADYPGVYARVTTVLDWIHKELGSNC